MANDDVKLLLDVVKMTIDGINQYTQQLITLAVGVLALSITFTKDIVKNISSSPLWLLMLSWLSFLVSIFFGIYTMNALTNALARPLLSNTSLDIQSITREISERANPFVAGQFISFFFGCIFIIAYGAVSLRKSAKKDKNATN